jgi:8-oxo-dGTP pyrophosphatase MutT (NUDIX family)
MNDNPWKTLDSKIVYQNPWITVHEDKVIHPGGGEGIYSVIDAKDGVLVIAEDADKNIYLMEAYRYPIKRWVLEAASGGIEPGDTPEICAQKELQEELGLTSNDWTALGGFAPSYGGAMADRQYVFLARNCVEGEHNREPGEAIRAVKKFTRGELFQMVKNGTVEDGQTLAGLLHYKMWIEENER